MKNVRDFFFLSEMPRIGGRFYGAFLKDLIFINSRENYL